MALPTEQDRELWRKATETPEQITAEERRAILQLADPAERVVNALKLSGMTPEELENKFLTNPESTTYEQCRLIQHGYHIWDFLESQANSSLSWPLADKMARIHAVGALRSPHERAVLTAVSQRTNFFAEESRRRDEMTMAKVAEEMGKPCKWVQKLIEPSVSVMKQSKLWGFVVLRDARTEESSHEAWENFLQQLDRHLHSGFMFLSGGSIINQTRQMVFHDGFVNESDPEDLQRAFQQTLPSGIDLNPRILSNTFLLVTPEVMEACKGPLSSTPWIWAYEANFVPSATPIAGASEKYEGRLKVSLYSLFTWFYAVRNEELYNMELFWEKAQRQPEQAWAVDTSTGRYHGPLVLLKKGSLYPFNTYELENEA